MESRAALCPPCVPVPRPSHLLCSQGGLWRFPPGQGHRETLDTVGILGPPDSWLVTPTKAPLCTAQRTRHRPQADGKVPRRQGSRDCVQGRKGEVHDSMLTTVAKSGCPHLPRACLLGHRREEAPLRPILACAGPCCPRWFTLSSAPCDFTDAGHEHTAGKQALRTSTPALLWVL